MRNFTASILLALALPVLMAGMFGCSGCAGKGRYDPITGMYDTNAPADIVVVTAETLRESALNTFDALMKFEKENEAVLRKLNPEIHTFTEKVRRESGGWLDVVTEAKVEYQKNRNPANADKLKDAMALLNSMLSTAAKHLSQAATAKPGGTP